MDTLIWRSAQTPGCQKGVALVVHGLNLKPSKMQAIAGCLRQGGIETLSVSLHGHGCNYHPRPGQSPAKSRLSSFRRVSAALWREELHAAYQIVRIFGERQRIPVFLAAFSLGGLVACDLLVSTPDVTFDRMVLWAPALTIRRWAWLLRPLARWPQLVVPSLAPSDYRANRGTSLAAYSAVYAAVEHLRSASSSRLDVPTLVFIDPEDELVSYAGLQRMVAKNRFRQWSIHSVRKDGLAAQAHYHHLIVDAQTMGPATWQEMARFCRHHLTE